MSGFEGGFDEDFNTANVLGNPPSYLGSWISPSDQQSPISIMFLNSILCDVTLRLHGLHFILYWSSIEGSGLASSNKERFSSASASHNG
jgi:hypothetical protein